MKIGILTLPLHTNYGGLLQAWALQMTLNEMGHEVTIINRVDDMTAIPFWHKTASIIKNELYIALGIRKRYRLVTNQLKNYSEQYVVKFRESRYTGISPDIKSDLDLKRYINQQKYDAFVVGSDQVWRPKYSPSLMTYFLDFVKNNNKIKKIAYAASFGVDKWELSEKETEEATELAKFFDIISVRESSAVDLVNKYLHQDAVHVLDPTMLRQKEDYIKLITQTTCRLYESKGELFCYVLDKTPFLFQLINKCHRDTGLIPFYCNSEIPYYRLTKDEDVSKCIVPPVEQWLKSFIDAKLIITDSFHGVVFSIIFNKPFWVIANNDRGTARFTSLLNLFGLRHRLIEDTNQIEWESEINWDVINMKINELSFISKKLLLDHI